MKVILQVLLITEFDCKFGYAFGAIGRILFLKIYLLFIITLQCLHDIISMTTITIQNLTAIKETLQWPLRGAERNSIDAKES